MRRLSAGGVPLLLMCYFLSAALCPFCRLPGRAEAAQPTSRQSSSADQLQHSKKLTGKWTHWPAVVSAGFPRDAHLSLIIQRTIGC